jgi:DNA-directed RNA polymerase subunit RPC12/RpoP
MENSWSPPENYEEIESDIKWVRVWAPSKKSLDAPNHKKYACPNCGAPTEFDIIHQSIACLFCGFLTKPNANIVGKSAKELEFRLDSLQKSTESWKASRDIFHCDNCGAELALEKADITATCPFCTSNKVGLQSAPMEEFEPQAIITIRITKEEVINKIKVWLGKGWFHPAQLSNSAIIQYLNALYIPVWTFDSSIDSTWNALVGYEKQESYYDSRDKTWKTRTKIDWRWENGTVNRFIDDMLIPGSKYVNARLFNHIEPFDLTKMADFNTDFLAGWKAHTYTKYLPDAWEEAKRNMRETMKNACNDQIPSQHVRNFSMTADFKEESWRYILLPVYLISYQYNQQIFQIMVNAQTGKIAGQKPVEWNKVWFAIFGLISPGVLTTILGLLLSLLGGIGIIFLVIGGVLFIIGLIISITIYQKAKNSEEGTSE